MCVRASIVELEMNPRIYTLCIWNSSHCNFILTNNRKTRRTTKNGSPQSSVAAAMEIEARADGATQIEVKNERNMKEWGVGGDAAKNAGLLYARMVLCSFATLAQFALSLNSEVNVNQFESHHIVLAASTYFIASNPVPLLLWLMAITITYRPMATLVATVDGGQIRTAQND